MLGGTPVLGGYCVGRLSKCVRSTTEVLRLGQDWGTSRAAVLGWSFRTLIHIARHVYERFRLGCCSMRTARLPRQWGCPSPDFLRRTPDFEEMRRFDGLPGQCCGLGRSIPPHWPANPCLDVRKSMSGTSRSSIRPRERPQLSTPGHRQGPGQPRRFDTWLDCRTANTTTSPIRNQTPRLERVCFGPNLLHGEHRFGTSHVGNGDARCITVAET